MKRQIQHVAVVTPVGAKHQQHSLVSGRRLLLSLFDLRVSIRIRGINIFLHVRGLLQLRRIGSLHADNPPLLSLLSPALRVSNAHGLAVGQSGLHLGFEDDALGGARPLSQTDNLESHAARFQREPEVHIGIGARYCAIRLNPRCRIGAVKRL